MEACCQEIESSNGELIEYTKTAPSGLNSDPCDPSNIEVGATNPRCSEPVIGTSSTIWCSGLSGGLCPTNKDEVTALRVTSGAIAPTSSPTTPNSRNLKVKFRTNSNSDSDVYTNQVTSRAEGVVLPIVLTDSVTVSGNSISGNIWEDSNLNALNDNSENQLANLTVNLLDTNNIIIKTTSTDTLGNYTFTDLYSGSYTVIVVKPVGGTQTFDNDNSLDDRTAVTVQYSDTTDGQNLENINFGYVLGSTISGSIYLDANNNGFQDTDESNFSTSFPVPPGVLVTITSTLDPLITFSPTINIDGSYTQTLPLGSYTVTITTGSDYTVSNSIELGEGTGANPTTVQVASRETKSQGKDGLFLVPIVSSSSSSSSDSSTSLTSSQESSSQINTSLSSSSSSSVAIVNSSLDSSTSSISSDQVSSVNSTTTSISSDISSVTTSQSSFTTSRISNQSSSSSQQSSSITTSNSSSNLSSSSSSTSSSNTPNSISGSVYKDTNNNGIREPAETPIVGVTINLYLPDNTLFVSTITDNEGKLNSLIFLLEFTKLNKSSPQIIQMVKTRQAI